MFQRIETISDAMKGETSEVDKLLSSLFSVGQRRGAVRPEVEAPVGGSVLPHPIEGTEFNYTSSSIHPMGIILCETAREILGQYGGGNQLEDISRLILRTNDKTLDIMLRNCKENLPVLTLEHESLERPAEIIYLKTMDQVSRCVIHAVNIGGNNVKNFLDRKDQPCQAIQDAYEPDQKSSDKSNVQVSDLEGGPVAFRLLRVSQKAGCNEPGANTDYALGQ